LNDNCVEAIGRRIGESEYMESIFGSLLHLKPEHFGIFQLMKNQRAKEKLM
jgi:hypothetical protein